MKKLFTFLSMLILCIGSMWATDVTVIDKTKDATTYGSLSGTVFTTNATSGMAGVTVSGIIGTTATNFAYGACLALTSTASGTITMTAPDNYKIIGYSLTARSNTYAVPYTLTPSAGGSAVTTSTGGVNLLVSGLDAQTASFTYSAGSANSFYIPAMTITIISTTTPTVNVTYELYESDGTTLVNSVEKEQEENSDIEVPTSLTAETYYDYSTEGSIGTSDCTIKVIRTLKSGYVISLDGLSNAKCYNIRNNRGTWAVGNGATVVNSTVELNLAFSSSDAKQQFALIYYDASDNDTDDGSYYLYSIGENKFAYVDGTKLSLTADFTAQVAASPVTFGSSTNSTYKYSAPILFKLGGNTYGVSTGMSPDVYKYNNDGDAGNATYIVEAGSFNASTATALIDFYYQHTITYVVKDESDNTLFTSDPINIHKGTYNTLPTEYHRDYFYTYATEGVTINDESAANTNLEFVATQKSDILQYTANTSSPIYYNLNIRNKYLAYNDEATGDVELLTTSNPFNPNAAWAFIGDPYTGFKIINQTNGTDKYLTYTSVVTARHSDNNIQFVDDSQFTDQYWFFDTNSSGFVLRMKANMDIYFHHDNSKNYLRTCSKTEWSAVHNDEGSTLIFASDEAVLQNLYNDLKDVYFADGVGKYTWNGSGTAEEARANINGAGLALEMHATSSYKDFYDALLDIKANITLNSVPAGFYRIKGNTSGKYLAAGLASNSKFNMTDATDATTIFYYDGTKLTNLSSGMCNGVTGSAWAWVVGSEASTVTFLDGHTPCGYGIQTATAYFYDNGDNSSSADRGTDVNMTSGDVRYRSWNLTEITEIPVTLKAAALGYATFCCPVPVKIPSGVEAYVSRIKDNTISLFKIENFKDAEDDVVIPANTAVMLHNNGDVSEDLTVSFEISNYSGEGVTDNGFYGTIAAESMVENDSYYSLRVWKVDDQATQVGFAAKAAGGTLAGFKGWIWQTGTTARNFTIVVDGESDPTGIVEALGLQEDNVDIYDLNGRKLSSYKKGINIVNGKKVMVQ